MTIIIAKILGIDKILELSKELNIYDEIPKRIIPYIASNFFLTPIVKAKHGSSSGVRGAAHLWN